MRELDKTWMRHFDALLRLCRRYDDELGEGVDAVFLAAAASACGDDRVYDLAKVSLETLKRYVRQAMGLCPENVKGYVECWRRYAS